MKNKISQRVNKTVLSLVLMITGYMVSCDNQLEEVNIPGEQLQVKAVVGETDSRAIIEGESFPDKSELGVTFLNANGTAYDGKSYTNIKATAAGTGNTQTWSLASKVLLSGTSGTLYAYYPYSSSVTDVAAVPVSASSSNQTDYMYATPVTGLHDGNPKASVTMKHALAAIRISLVKGSYTGAGLVTAVSVKGDGMATSATLNAKTGGLSACTGMGTNIKVDKSMTLSATAQQTDIIFVPVSTVTASPVFTVTIDGKDYSVTGSAVKFEQNNLYTYTLTVNSKDISFSDVKIGEWSYNATGNPVIDVGHKITLAGDVQSLAFNLDIEGNNLTIKALPVVDGTYANKISSSLSGMVQNVDAEGVLTATLDISTLTADATLIFNGCKNFNGWLKLTYNVTDASKAVNVFSSNSNFNISNVAEMSVIETGSSPKALLEGITPAKTYIFSSIGEHTVYVRFSDATKIPAYAFYQCSQLTGITVHKEVTSIGNMAFNDCGLLTRMTVVEENTTYDSRSNCNAIIQTATNTLVTGCWNSVIPQDCEAIAANAFRDCKNLLLVDIPNSVKTMGESAFTGCTGVKSITIGSGLTDIPYNAFSNNFALTSLVLGNSVQSISDDAFMSCRILPYLNIPNSVRTIGEAAFNQCYALTEVVIGTGVTFIDTRAFSYCSVLEKITSKATVAPTVTGDTFEGVKSSGKLYVPRGYKSAYNNWMRTDYDYLGKKNWTCVEY